jgi:hypothetical protein
MADHAKKELSLEFQRPTLPSLCKCSGPQEPKTENRKPVTDNRGAKCARVSRLIRFLDVLFGPFRP